MKLGEWATLSDASSTKVSFTNVLQDTRCALDVNCYHGGSVRVAITIESGGKAARFDLSSLSSDYRSAGAFNGYLVQFLDLAPARKTSNISIPPNDYQVTCA